MLSSRDLWILCPYPFAGHGGRTSSGIPITQPKIHPIRSAPTLIPLLQAGRNLGIVENGSKIVVVTGWKTGAGSTNTMRVLTVGDTDNFINKYGMA